MNESRSRNQPTIIAHMHSEQAVSIGYYCLLTSSFSTDSFINSKPEVDNELNRPPVFIKLSDSPDAELGLFANRDFRRGELVLEEEPFMVIPSFQLIEGSAEEEVKCKRESKSDHDIDNQLDG